MDINLKHQLEAYPFKDYNASFRMGIIFNDRPTPSHIQIIDNKFMYKDKYYIKICKMYPNKYIKELLKNHNLPTYGIRKVLIKRLFTRLEGRIE